MNCKGSLRRNEYFSSDTFLEALHQVELGPARLQTYVMLATFLLDSLLGDHISGSEENCSTCTSCQVRFALTADQCVEIVSSAVSKCK